MPSNAQVHAASPSIKSVANSGPVAKELEGTSFVSSRTGLGPPQGADPEESKPLPGIENPETHCRKLCICLPMRVGTSLLLASRLKSTSAHWKSVRWAPSSPVFRTSD